MGKRGHGGRWRGPRQTGQGQKRPAEDAAAKLESSAAHKKGNASVPSVPASSASAPFGKPLAASAQAKPAGTPAQAKPAAASSNGKGSGSSRRRGNRGGSKRTPVAGQGASRQQNADARESQHPKSGSQRHGTNHQAKRVHDRRPPHAPERHGQHVAERRPQHTPSRRRGCDHVFFIGFLGAGKTTVARNLGNMFHRSFIDVDRMVERELHASVARIFATRGEPAFRDAETEALKTLENRKSLLVSCGGGVIERPENVEIMRKMGKIVYLDGTLEDSLRQIRRPDKRPDLGDHAHARALYAHRRPLYESACDYRVSISGKSFEQVAYEVGELLWEKGLL